GSSEYGRHSDKYYLSRVQRTLGAVSRRQAGGVSLPRQPQILPRGDVERSRRDSRARAVGCSGGYGRRRRFGGEARSESCAGPQGRRSATDRAESRRSARAARVNRETEVISPVGQVVNLRPIINRQKRSA